MSNRSKYLKSVSLCVLAVTILSGCSGERMQAASGDTGPLTEEVSVNNEPQISEEERIKIIRDAVQTGIICSVDDVVSSGNSDTQRHTLHNIACNARSAFENYKSNRLSPDAIGEAAQAASLYLDEASQVQAADYYALDKVGMGAVIEASDFLKHILGTLNKIPLKSAEVNASRAVLMLQLSELDQENGFEKAVEGFSLLEKAVEKDEAVLDGLGLAVLGRVYYELPTIVGGDNLKAIEFLTRGYERNPTSPVTIQYLAEAYDQEIEEEKAKAMMANLVAIPATDENSQELADALRIAAGLSRRLRDKPLAKQLNDKRDALLEANPNLFDRKMEASGGHGGENPLTGK